MNKNAKRQLHEKIEISLKKGKTIAFANNSMAKNIFMKLAGQRKKKIPF